MILVTGGTGLLGQHLLEKLSAQQKIRAIFRTALPTFYASLNHGNIEWVEADITDIISLEKAFEGITQVYHCAAIVSYDPRMKERMMQTNIEGTANVVNLCLDHQLKKLCYVSSIATLGEGIIGELISEKNDWEEGHTNSNYAVSKQGAEMEVWRGQQEGLNVLIVNPGVILGPGFPEQGSGALISAVAKGLSFYTLGTTGFIAVTDVVETSVRLMKSNIQNERFTLIENNYSFQEILNCIADSLQVKRPRWHATPLLINLFWRVDWFLSNFFFQKRKLSRASAKASYSKTEYANIKIISTLASEFKSVKEYIQFIAQI
jgi:nucleoside-diphosphate-sugar epimerase